MYPPFFNPVLMSALSSLYVNRFAMDHYSILVYLRESGDGWEESGLKRAMFALLGMLCLGVVVCGSQEWC